MTHFRKPWDLKNTRVPTCLHHSLAISAGHVAGCNREVGHYLCSVFVSFNYTNVDVRVSLRYNQRNLNNRMSFGTPTPKPLFTWMRHDPTDPPRKANPKKSS